VFVQNDLLHEQKHEVSYAIVWPSHPQCSAWIQLMSPQMLLLCHTEVTLNTCC